MELANNCPLAVLPSGEISFPGPFNRRISSLMQLSNNGSRPMAFVIKSTAPKGRIIVRPREGMLRPKQTLPVYVQLNPDKSCPSSTDPPSQRYRIRIDAILLAPGTPPTFKMDWKTVQWKRLTVRILICRYDPGPGVVKKQVAWINGRQQPKILTGKPGLTWDSSVGKEFQSLDLTKNDENVAPNNQIRDQPPKGFSRPNPSDWSHNATAGWDDNVDQDNWAINGNVHLIQDHVPSAGNDQDWSNGQAAETAVDGWTNPGQEQPGTEWNAVDANTGWDNHDGDWNEPNVEDPNLHWANNVDNGTSGQIVGDAHADLANDGTGWDGQNDNGANANWANDDNNGWDGQNDNGVGENWADDGNPGPVCGTNDLAKNVGLADGAGHEWGGGDQDNAGWVDGQQEKEPGWGDVDQANGMWDSDQAGEAANANNAWSGDTPADPSEGSSQSTGCCRHQERVQPNLLFSFDVFKDLFNTFTIILVIGILIGKCSN